MLNGNQRDYFHINLYINDDIAIERVIQLTLLKIYVAFSCFPIEYECAKYGSYPSAYKWTHTHTHKCTTKEQH